MIDILLNLFVTVVMIVLCVLLHSVNKDVKLYKNKNKELEEKINQILLEKTRDIKIARLQSNKTQQAVIKGKISEEIAPLLPNFPYEVKDLKFSGQPIDYICYRGLGDDEITEIVFLEIKTGGAELNSRQRQIKTAIENGKVKFDIFKIK